MAFQTAGAVPPPSPNEPQGMFQAGPQGTNAQAAAAIPPAGAPDQGADLITESLDNLTTFAIAQREQGNPAVADALQQLILVITQGGGQMTPPDALGQLPPPGPGAIPQGPEAGAIPPGAPV